MIGIDVSAEAIAECHRRGTSEARLEQFFVSSDCARARAMKRLMRNNHGRGVQNSDLFLPPPVLNWTLLHLLRTENAAFRHGLNSPFGAAP